MDQHPHPQPAPHRRASDTVPAQRTPAPAREERGAYDEAVRGLGPEPDAQLRIHRTATRLIAELRGEIDLETALRIGPLLDAVTAGPRLALIVDLRRVDFFDGSGVRLLARIRSRVLEREGRLTVVCDRPLVLRVLRAARVLDVFRPVASLTEAIAT
ncbi:STAS domain-containing protein [Streptomyces monticola]|uniref:Anti-sigma factor antagonist n=1 Tax=Streptomyces monticola TaxID=2666263 RepID=A0ABW2JT73_9ACTN